MDKFIKDASALSRSRTPTMPSTPQERYVAAASLRFHTSLIGMPDEFTFNAAYPHTYCKICGEVFQRAADRDPTQNILDILDNQEIRRNWSCSHARTHPSRLHNLLKLSGVWALPDAVIKLATYGIHTIGSGVLNEEVKFALSEAPRMPNNDVEGSR